MCYIGVKASLPRKYVGLTIVFYICEGHNMAFEFSQLGLYATFINCTWYTNGIQMSFLCSSSLLGELSQAAYNDSKH